MLKFVLVITVFLFYTVYTDTLKCGPHEVEDNCPDNCTDSCPTRVDEFIHCRRPKRTHCPPPQCRCQFNYRRAENGTCIPTTKCPAFDCPEPNEEYNPCPPYCPTDNCDQATPHGECPYMGFLIIRECFPTCRCIPKYWRRGGVCVPYQDCNKIDYDYL